jgi:hypothetical protein
VDSVLTTVAFDIGENGLSIVVFGTVAFSVLMSLLFMATRGGGGGSVYDEIGRGGFSREGEPTVGMLAPAPGTPAASAEQEAEIRQMLRARSERLQRKGEPALDIDAELARLLTPQPASGKHDPGLIEEVRQLVLARNERRARHGLEPLDVETEVTRTLQEMDP